MARNCKIFEIAVAAVTIGALPTAAEAVPSFSEQTGQPCITCHVGAFGPQLTPFGRAFKIGGYTMSGGDGWASKMPLSAMVTTSFTNTRQEQATAPHHYDTNNNPSLDQISIFVAGRLGDYSGGFVQLTYSGVSNVSHVDNADLRPFTTSVALGAHELRVGTTINNNPTAQDPYNSTFAWGFPYIQSALAPTPAAQPMLVSAFNANTLGYTAYVWLDNALYLEAGAYTSPGGWTLARFGNDLGGQGAIVGAAPYARVAYEYQWNNQAAHIGALYMRADLNPPTGVPFQSSGDAGQDRYTDYAFDAGYQFLGDGTHIVTVQGIYVHEDQQRNATGSGGAFALNQVRANVSYWYQNTYGATFGWQKTWGTLNPAYGTANGKPNSNAFILEADWVPFGRAESFANPWVNLKLGVQYIAYTQFDGGFSNYDGNGRGPGANNTLLLFGWLAF